MKYKPELDMSTIPDQILTSEYKRRLGIKGNAARKTFGGGRPPSCVCGECANCKRREKAKTKR